MRNHSSLQNVCAKFSLALFLTAASYACAAVDWDKKQYNPEKFAKNDDVLLPMPCGGAMAFRKVETEADGILGDQTVRLGDPNPAVGYKENSIETPVAGAFRGDKPRTRYFLLGKYELTQLQYQSVMSPSCPPIAEDSNLPQAGLNWFEAVEFVNKYTLWLLNNAKDKLPGDGDNKGFVRLPTEAEWEFAARGGLLTSGNSSVFQASLFPMPNGGLNQYVWYQGGDSSNNGKAQRIGLLNPNPLGLHDILGNLDEIVFDPFHLTRHARLHGQAGGYVVRGGNSQMAASAIRSSSREEVPFYQEAGPRKSKTTGLRVAVAAAVLNRKNLSEISAEWEKLGIKETPPPAAVSSKAAESAPPAVDTQSKQIIEELKKQCQGVTPGPALSSCPELMPNLSSQSLPDPLAELNDLATKANQPSLKIRLNNLRVDVAATIESGKQERNKAAREALRAAAMICLKLHDDYAQVVERNEKLFALQGCGAGSNHPDCPGLSAKMAKYAGVIQFNKDVYADTVVKLSQSYSPDVLESQKGFLLQEIERKSYTGFSGFLNRSYADIKAFQQDKKIETENWYKNCKSVVQK